MKESEQQRLIEEQNQCGLSVREFCSNQGFSPATFYNWKKKLREKEQLPCFVPLVFKDKNGTNELSVIKEKKNIDDKKLEFTFPNGTRLKIEGNLDLSLLKDIIHLY